jgi:very-short-patch-repair endonuclease
MSIKVTHPEIAVQWHPTKNGDLTPDKVMAGSNASVWWLCPNTCSHGCLHEWQVRVNDRTNKNTGCPQCCNFLQKICVHQSIAYTHPTIVKEWHPTLNGDLKPDQFPAGSEKRIEWQCKKNSAHTWKTAINNRCGNNYSECPYCINKTECKLFNYLNCNYGKVERQFKLTSCRRKNPLPFDICILDKKVIVEIDGAQHFKQISNWLDPEETLRRDIFKMQQAEKEGYKVIRVCQQDLYNGDYAWINENIVAEIESSDRNHMFISVKEDLYNKHIELYSSGTDIKLLAGV